MLFEFPLNEKIRNFLRLEYLLSQVTQVETTDPDSCLQFFHSLFDLIELLERMDIRQDLIKDLERIEVDLARWEQLPSVNQQSILDLKTEVCGMLVDLRGNTRLTRTLKADKFLASIRQRFAIPGGCCGFDLPQLHLWLNRPAGEHQEQIAHWVKQLSLLNSGIRICLQVLRERGRFSSVQANSGFFQDSAEGKQLVRIRMVEDTSCYPTVSGSKHRFSVRFQQFSELGSTPVEGDQIFEISAC